MEEAALKQLVDQIEQKQSLSPRVRQAFLTVPRRRFVPRHYAQRERSLRWTQMETDGPTVYEDQALVTQIDARGMPSSSSSQPSLMAAMLEALHVQLGQRILEIGTGTGYNAALLSCLVGVLGQVVTIDIDEQLVEEARQRLQGIENVQVACANGLHGYAQAGPYDHIIVTGGFPFVPQEWLTQLVPGGTLVVNLLFPLSHGIVAFAKQAEDGTGSGWFLPHTNVAFLHLRNEQQALQPISPIQLARYEQQALIKQECVPSPVLQALDDPTFLFYLQWQEPELVLRSKWGSTQASHPTASYVLDPTTLTSIMYPTNSASDVPVVTRGQYPLFERIQKVYQQWETLSRPTLDAYRLEIQAGGQHTIALGSHCWMLRID